MRIGIGRLCNDVNAQVPAGWGTPVYWYRNRWEHRSVPVYRYRRIPRYIVYSVHLLFTRCPDEADWYGHRADTPRAAREHPAASPDQICPEHPAPSRATHRVRFSLGVHRVSHISGKIRRSVLTMQFTGNVAGQQACLLLDSGATHSFMNSRVLQAAGCDHHPQGWNCHCSGRCTPTHRW